MGMVVCSVVLFCRSNNVCDWTRCGGIREVDDEMEEEDNVGW